MALYLTSTGEGNETFLTDHSIEVSTLFSLSVQNQTAVLPSSKADDQVLTVLERLFVITYEEYLAARRVLRILVYILLPVAIALTCINIFIFRHPRMRSSAGTYIIGISIAQIIYLVNYSIEVVLALTLEGYIQNYYYLCYAMFFTNYVAVITLRGSFLVMCVLSAERLFAVLRPLHIKTFLLSKRPVLFCLGSFGVAAVWHVYLHAKYRVVPVDTGTSIIYVYSTTWLYRQTAAVADGFSISAKVLFTLGSLVVRLVLSVLTIWGLRRHNLTTSRGVSSSSAEDDVKRKRERQMTVTILTASLSSVILYFPSAFHFVFGIIFPEYYSHSGKYSNFYRIINMFSGTFALFYCALDFICFVAASSNYRAVLCGFALRFLGMVASKKNQQGKVCKIEVDPSTGESVKKNPPTIVSGQQ
ncbi:lysophosphatidic acid receptor 5-like [Littorina saxatilis]|uniref:lysophosphatidic acid receptor 5-like n=1 Tax=Littorina saxatilis TaxID=31220 RepID=UPI0038B54E9D